MSTLILRKIESDQSLILELPSAERVQVTVKKGSVVAKQSRDSNAIIAIWPAYSSRRPDYRHRYVMLNCSRYAVEWERKA